MENRIEMEKNVWLEKKSEYEALIDLDAAAGFLGYKESKPDENIAQEMQMAAKLLLVGMRPRYMFRLVKLSRRETDSAKELLAVFGEQNLLLPGESLRGHLGDAELAVAGCLTLGEGVDQVLCSVQKESMLTAILIDALANAAVEQLRAGLEKDAAKTFGLSVGWLFGIGYGDLPLGLQRPFLECMNAKENLKLTANEQMVLCPTKSVTGFLNIENGKKEEKKRCNGKCSSCPKRESCRIFGGNP